jgi:predicted lipid carrier protein YhbT
MPDATAVPLIPAPIALLMRPLPLLPLRVVLQRIAASVGRRYPQLFSRLEGHTAKTFLVDPVDLPIVLRLAPRPNCPSIEPRWREEGGEWDARIAGPFAALVGMIHGSCDGDALFFSRDLTIEGDTEAVLALRNALDDAEIDLPAEIAAAFGLIDTLADRLARRVIPAMSRVTGLALTRHDGPT